VSFEAVPAEGPLRGTLAMPGDKSISHRAVLFAAMAEGTSRLTGVLDSDDVRSTIDAVSALGADVETLDVGKGTLTLDVTGWGEVGPASPAEALDCGNSGTTARLLLGVLAGWDAPCTLVGDGSLSERPMRRVIEPLAAMGARFEAREGDLLPVHVAGGSLGPLDYETPMASAQVKTAVLIAGLRAAGRTSVREPAPSRDHTERMLPAFGVTVGHDAGQARVWVDGPVVPVSSDVDVPGDPSSAAFFACAAAIVPGSRVSLPGVGVNPTRTAYVRVLERMGARIQATATRESGGEPVGDLSVDGPEALEATVVGGDEVPSLIDEVPVLAVVAARGRGVTRFEDVGELRVKESDRLAAVAEGLATLGARVRTGPDWLEVEGPAELTGGRVDAHGDHRLAMAYHVAGLVASAPVAIEGYEAVRVSFPGFAAAIAGLERP
jgi:3-phosphoshikimate 1-carboxyvinyltransferase